MRDTRSGFGEGVGRVVEGLGDGDPRAVGTYRLLGRLGEGGMGCVYLGRSATGRTVAVKLIRAELAGRADFRGRFRQEVESARRVGGAWTAPVLDADCDAEVPWVVTGYVPGPSLAEVVGAYGPLPEHSVRTLAAGLGHALADIHAAGLVHRDLKPGNVLVTIGGPKVIDFGIAKGMAGTGLAATGPTGTGVVVGSPGCMSPEQIRDERLGPASDVFALGTVLAYAATGRLPFGDGSGTGGLHAVMFRIAAGQPDLTGVPEPVADLVRACCAQEPRDRPEPAELIRRAASGPAVSPWLPPALIADLGQRAAQLLDAEPTEGGTPGGGTPDATHRSGPPAPHQSHGGPDYGGQGHGGPAPGGRGYGGPDYGSPDYGSPDYGSPDYGSQGHGGQGHGGRFGPPSAPAPPVGPVVTSSAPVSPPAQHARRGLLVGGAVAGVLAVGAAVAVPLLKGEEEPAGARGPQAAPTAPPGRGEEAAPLPGAALDPPAPSASGGAKSTKTPDAAGARLPEEFHGTWIGSVLKDGKPLGQDRRFTLSAGGTGDAVLRGTSIDAAYECTSSGTLKSVRAGTVTLTGSFVSGVPRSRCNVITAQSLRRGTGDTLVWKGLDRTATLRRVAPGSERVPANLVGTWTRELASGGTQKVTVRQAAPGARAVTLVSASDEGKKCVSYANLFTASGGAARIGPAVVDRRTSAKGCETGSSSTLRASGEVLTRSYPNGSAPRTYRKGG
ncbi:serine/threonine-protein kinase [Streptomyces cremeus]|uniref:Protein kinase n=1 Tax=Streptomyces cremeus TaxID=66881 RepID=A0ABV5PC53_STRCM